MKKTPSVFEAVDPAGSIQASASSHKEDLKQHRESANLSPERLKYGASATTEVLQEILARDDRAYSVSHWGINE